jgi:RNA polymerase sigma-70 factor (sigma-E family)
VNRDADFTAFVEARWGRLVRAARLLGCGPEEAEDLVQTTLTRCYVSWRRVADSDEPDAYVYQVLLNTMRTSKRRRWWGEVPAADVGDRMGSVDPSDVEARTDLQRALAQLPDEQRAVVVLRYYADMTESATGRALNIATGTVKSRASRALVRLGELLGSVDDDPHGAREAT